MANKLKKYRVGWVENHSCVVKAYDDTEAIDKALSGVEKVSDEDSEIDTENVDVCEIEA